MPAQICYFFRVCIFILRTYVRTCRIPPHRRTQKGFPLRGSCRRSRLMRRSVVRSELSPRFGKAKAPLGDQGELSAKLTERIRTLLFRLYQRRNELTEGFGCYEFASAPCYPPHPYCTIPQSASLTAPFTQRSLWMVQTRCISKAFGLLLFRRFAPPSPQGEGLGLY